MEGKDELTDLAKTFMEQLKSSGMSSETVLSYRFSLKRIIKFAHCQGKCSYYLELNEEYRSHLNQRLMSGEIKNSTWRFNIRVLRMFISYVETGEIDYSAKPRNQRLYILSKDGEKLAQDILEYSDIPEQRYKDNIAIVRHILYYAKENGHEYTELNDEILLNFLHHEIAKENVCDMSRVIRAIRCVAKYFTDHNIGNIQYSYNNIKVKSPGRKLLPPFEPSEVKAMIDCLDTDNLIDMRNRAMILLGYTTGLRCIDVIKLRKNEIDWRKQCLHITQRKTGVPMTIEIPPMTLNALADYILKTQDYYQELYANTDFVFITEKWQHKEITRSLNRMIKSVEERAGITHINNRGFHGLRRSFAVSLASAEVPLETLSKMLGHISPHSDKVYLSFNREQIKFIALDFRDVPLNSKVYNTMFNIT